MRTAAALQLPLAQPQVKAVYLNKAFHRVASANLNLAAQPAVSAVSHKDAGSTGTVNCHLGTMSNGATASFDITVLWNAGSTQGLSVSVSSDLPDSQASNNRTTLNVLSTPDTSAADALTLPEWATMVLASLMLFVMARGQGQRH